MSAGGAGERQGRARGKAARCSDRPAPTGDTGARGEQSPACSAPATFRSIYTSRDGRLAVFEDERGHLTSVRTARFA